MQDTPCRAPSASTQLTGDPALAELMDELRAYPDSPQAQGQPQAEGELLGVAMPFQLRSDAGELSFISTTTVFGTAVDVTLQELTLETFFPADAFTGEVLRKLHG